MNQFTHQFIPNNSNNNKAEFDLLITYYNFRIKFKKKFIKGQNNSSFIEKTFYLIDKKWLKNWEKYIGYEDIRDIMGKDNIDRELINADYNWIEDIYKKTSAENVNYPLTNKNIYYDGKLIPLSEFFIIDKNCLDLFISLYNGFSLNNEKSYPIKFLKEKILLRINKKMFLVLFKENGLHFELLVILTTECENIFLDFLQKNNILDLLIKKYNFNIYSDEEYNIKENNCELKIINKTLKIKKQDNYFDNSIIPKYNNTKNHFYIQNENPISSDMEKKIEERTFITDKNIQINNNIFNRPMNRVGLQNVGQSCYMNATIQCLNNVREFSDKLLNIYKNKQFDIKKQPLTVSFSCLLQELNNTQNKYIVPSVFKQIIGALNPLFEGIHAADSKDLIFFFIEKLHKELNKAPQNQQEENNNIDYQQQELESRNEIIMFNKFIKDFYQKNNSFISNNFYGITRVTMKCDSCNLVKYSFQTFNLLIFQLRKTKEEKKKELGYNKQLNLYDAFEVEQKEELLSGENMIYCNNCKGLRNGKHQQRFYGFPNVMIIILNRGKDNKDFNEEFIIYEKLDFTKKNLIVNKESYQKFFLCGVVTHLGESGSSGHFIAYCRNDPNSTEFICYNDTIVSNVSIKDALSSNISRNDFEKKTPYILLYHRME